MPLCVQAMVAAVEKNMPPTVRSILMTPKNHTRNILPAKLGDFASHNAECGNDIRIRTVLPAALAPEQCDAHNEAAWNDARINP